MNRAAAVLIGFLVAVAGCCIAQDRALLSGDAEDKQDNPIAGVLVVLSNPELGIERKATTNSDGYYAFAEVVPGEGYIISVTAPGYTFAPQRVKFDIAVGDTRRILPLFVGEPVTAANPAQSHLVPQVTPRFEAPVLPRFAVPEFAARLAVTVAPTRTGLSAEFCALEVVAGSESRVTATTAQAFASKQEQRNDE